jgi:hypothetical protein
MYIIDKTYKKKERLLTKLKTLQPFLQVRFFEIIYRDCAQFLSQKKSLALPVKTLQDI